MENCLLQIDFSNSKYKSDEDSIEIRFENEEPVEISFSKLVSQSKYIRDKYRYSEALKSLQTEINQLQDEYNIDKESVKLFIQLILTDKINIPIERYKDIYALSEYFCIPKFIFELDVISQTKLFNDLNFTIQNLFDSKTSKKRLETTLESKIENFLSNRINECFQNAKFSQLPISTIWRILEESGKKSVNHDLLIEFILKSIKTRFILLKFVDMNRLTESKFYEFIKIIDDEEEETKNKCMEYLPFSISLIKRLKNKYEEVLDEMKQTKDKLNEEINKFKEAKEESRQTQHQLKQTKEELKQANLKLEQTKEKLEQSEREMQKAKKEIDQMKIQYAQSIMVVGYDKYCQLAPNPNKTTKSGSPILDPPVIRSRFFNASVFLSFQLSLS